MLNTALSVLVTLSLAIGGGAASVWYVLGNQSATGALTIGQWTAYPKIGAPGADPYSKAQLSREGVLALGSAEGVAFSAVEDSAGRPLRLECNYRIEGIAPPARFWTLFAERRSSASMGMTATGRLSALNSQGIVRRADNSFRRNRGPQRHVRQLVGRFRHRSHGRGADRLQLYCGYRRRFGGGQHARHNPAGLRTGRSRKRGHRQCELSCCMPRCSA